MPPLNGDDYTTATIRHAVGQEVSRPTAFVPPVNRVVRNGLVDLVSGYSVGSGVQQVAIVPLNSFRSDLRHL